MSNRQKLKIFTPIFFAILLAWLITSKFKIYTRPNGRAFVILKTHTPKQYDLVVYQNPLNNTTQISRVIAVPGDTVQLIEGIAFINGKKEKNWQKRSFIFSIFFDKKSIKKKFEPFKIAPNTYKTTFEFISKQNDNKFIFNKLVVNKKFYQPEVFPFSFRYRWNSYFMKKFVCPYRKMKIKNTLKNKSLYRFLLEKYEAVNQNGDFFVFRNNYYFLLNDERYNSNDCRTLAPIPQNLIEGKILFYLKK